MKIINIFIVVALVVSCSKGHKGISIDNLQDTVTTITIDSVVSNSEILGIDFIQGKFPEIYKYNHKPAQEFSFKASQVKKITCKEGTVIEYKPNLFVYKGTQTKVEGDVQLIVWEYYSISSMLLANLSTKSNGELLETGGMVYIKAMADGKECELAKGRTIGISYPLKTKEEKKEMQLFYGDWDNNQNMNWQLAATPNKKIETNNISIENISQTNSYDQSYNSITKGGLLFRVLSNSEYENGDLEEDVKRKLAINKNDITKQVIEKNYKFYFQTDTLGKINYVGFYTACPVFLKNALENLINSDIIFTPGTYIIKDDSRKIVRNGETTFDFLLKFTADNIKLQLQSASVWMPEDIEKNFLDSLVNKAAKNTPSIINVSSYAFSSSQLGWLNCDRLIGDGKERVTYNIDTENITDVNVKVILKNYRSIVINNFALSIGEPVRIVIIKKEKNKFYIASKDSEVKREVETGFTFKEVSLTEIREEVERLSVW